MGDQILDLCNGIKIAALAELAHSQSRCPARLHLSPNIEGGAAGSITAEIAGGSLRSSISKSPVPPRSGCYRVGALALRMQAESLPAILQ